MILLNTAPIGTLLLHTLLFSILGIVVLVTAFWILEKVTPQSMWKEILEKQNNALAIVFAAFIIGISIIIAAALHG